MSSWLGPMPAERFKLRGLICLFVAVCALQTMAGSHGPPISYAPESPPLRAEPSDGPAPSHGPQPSQGPQPFPGPLPSHGPQPRQAQVVLRAAPGTMLFCLQQSEAILWLAIWENHQAQYMFQDSGTALLFVRIVRF